MSTYRKKLQAGGNTEQPDPARERQLKKQSYLDMLNNPNATVEELREALAEAIATIDGVEARMALQNLELSAAKEAIRERRKRPA